MSITNRVIYSNCTTHVSMNKCTKFYVDWFSTELRSSKSIYKLRPKVRILFLNIYTIHNLVFSICALKFSIKIPQKHCISIIILKNELY